jgi:Protein of unknown function (DUF4236)
MARRRISLGGGSYLNLNKKGTSITKKLSGGLKLTTSSRRTTLTTKIGKGLSISSITGKRHSIKLNRGKLLRMPRVPSEV